MPSPNSTVLCSIHEERHGSTFHATVHCRTFGYWRLSNRQQLVRPVLRTQSFPFMYLLAPSNNAFEKEEEEEERRRNGRNRRKKKKQQQKNYRVNRLRWAGLFFVFAGFTIIERELCSDQMSSFVACSNFSHSITIYYTLISYYCLCSRWGAVSVKSKKKTTRFNCCVWAFNLFRDYQFHSPSSPFLPKQLASNEHVQWN